MATKEDILEQIVEEYLILQGYFVQHNLKYRPDTNHPDYVSKLDSVHSDIDIIGINPKLNGSARVLAVNCKSYQDGFQPKYEISEFENPKRYGRERWKSYREVNSKKWAEAFRAKVLELTCSNEFTHVTAVTRLRPTRGYSEQQLICLWETYPPFNDIMGGNPIRVLTLEKMIAAFNEATGTTPASSEVGRLIQVLRAAGLWSTAQS